MESRACGFGMVLYAMGDGDQDATSAAGVDAVVDLGDVLQREAIADLDGQGVGG
jgi:hypothetical protein